jgi:hypothetical protein
MTDPGCRLRSTLQFRQGQRVRSVDIPFRTGNTLILGGFQAIHSGAIMRIDNNGR